MATLVDVDTLQAPLGVLRRGLSSSQRLLYLTRGLWLPGYREHDAIKTTFLRLSYAEQDVTGSNPETGKKVFQHKFLF